MGDFQLVRKGIDFSKRRKKWLVLIALVGASSYGAYMVYHSPAVTRKRKRIARVVDDLPSAVEMVSDSVETVATVSKDVNEFLRSDSDKIPNSLNQIFKLAQSNEFSRSWTKLLEAATVGTLRGYYHQSQTGATEIQSNRDSSPLFDRVIDRVLSDAGKGFVSVVVGSFARNLVLGFYPDNGNSEQRPNSILEKDISGSGTDSELDGSNTGSWVDTICQDKSKELIANCVQVFVSTAVAAYLDKTMDVNTYDELFAGLTNPKHETKVRDMLVSVCNGVVETFVKTSHRVLTTKKMNEAGSSYSSANYSETNTPGECSYSNEEEKGLFIEREREEDANMNQKWDFDKMSRSQWVETVSSTFADPNNRRFVISMTGRVTFETLRSVVEFLLRKILDGLRRSTDIVHAQVVGKGLEVVGYFSARSSVIITICLALYLHVLCGTTTPQLLY